MTWEKQPEPLPEDIVIDPDCPPDIACEFLDIVQEWLEEDE